ncbi:MAG: hypothetical protein ACRDNM_00800 [Gaiellaceae bacterium]
MSKWAAHRQALALLDRHPGWSDRRIACLLALSNSTVSRWRSEAGLPRYRKRVRSVRRRTELLPLHTDDEAALELRRIARRGHT